MSFKKTTLAAAIAGAAAVPMAAHALTIDGITFEAGAVIETIDLFEAEKFGDSIGNDNGLIDAVGEVLVGIGRVNAIRDNDNNVLWQNGDNGRELTIYFDNYVAEDIAFGTSTGIGGTILDTATISFTGGDVFLYSDSAQDFSAAGSQAAGIATATGGDLFLQLAGSPVGGTGLLSGAPITLLSFSTVPDGADPLTTTGANIAGQGNLDVVGGSAGDNFDTNQFGCLATAGAPCPDDADKTFTSSGQIPVGGFNDDGWGFRGTGEVQDFAVPEPGTVALLGVGFAGAAFARRRLARKA